MVSLHTNNAPSTLFSCWSVQSAVASGALDASAPSVRLTAPQCSCGAAAQVYCAVHTSPFTTDIIVAYFPHPKLWVRREPTHPPSFPVLFFLFSLYIVMLRWNSALRYRLSKQCPGAAVLVHRQPVCSIFQCSCNWDKSISTLMCVFSFKKKIYFFSVFERDPIAQNIESESLEQELMVVVMWMLATVTWGLWNSHCKCLQHWATSPDSPYCCAGDETQGEGHAKE